MIVVDSSYQLRFDTSNLEDEKRKTEELKEKNNIYIYIYILYIYI